MERFEPKVLLLATSLELWVASDESISHAGIKNVVETLGVFTKTCKELGLNLTLKSLKRATKLIEEPKPDYKKFQESCNEVLSRLRDELDGVYLIALTAKESSYYEEWWNGWLESNVMERFYSANYDVEEASKSLACGRATACVFHLMRVMELGLRVVAKELGIPYAPSWESYIRQMHVNIEKDWKKKSAEWKKKEPFFKEVLGLLQSVKIAWRNPTMHLVNQYSLEQAEDIFNAVRGFMRHLATELSEDDGLQTES